MKIIAPKSSDYAENMRRLSMKVNLQLLAANEATAAFYKSVGYTIEPRVSMGKMLLQLNQCDCWSDCRKQIIPEHT